VAGHALAAVKTRRPVQAIACPPLERGAGPDVDRELGVVRAVGVHGHQGLTHVAQAGRLLGRQAGPAQGREQQRRQDGDDGNHHQQLDQCEVALHNLADPSDPPDLTHPSEPPGGPQVVIAPADGHLGNRRKPHSPNRFEAFESSSLCG